MTFETLKMSRDGAVLFVGISAPGISPGVRRLRSTSGQRLSPRPGAGGYGSLSTIAAQTMSASLTAAMLLMVLAGSMYVMSIALGRLGCVLR